MADISTSLGNLTEYVDESNRTYIDPIANSVRATFDPWFHWSLDIADRWFVAPFDRRRKPAQDEKAVYGEAGKEEVDGDGDGDGDGAVTSITAAAATASLGTMDMTSINTSIDVTGDRNDSTPVKSAEI